MTNSLWFPLTPEEFSREWVEQAFSAQAGSLHSLRFEPVGTGQVCDSYRFSCDWAADDSACLPASFIAKCPSADANSRGAAATFHLYDIEVGWYRDFATASGVNCPLPYYATIGTDEQSFALLLQDMAPASQGDQLAGASLAQVRSALSEAATLHAYRPTQVRLEETSWVLHGEKNSAYLRAAIAASYAAFSTRFAGRLSEDILDLGERLTGKLASYYERQPLERCIAHGDMRLDNILYSDDGATACLVDWQTTHLGSAAADVAYLIGTSFADPATRAREERGLVESYLARRAAIGAAVDFATFWADYRLHAFSGFLMAITASLTVQQTERGDEMFALMAERPATMALDLDSLALL